MEDLTIGLRYIHQSVALNIEHLEKQFTNPFLGLLQRSVKTAMRERKLRRWVRRENKIQLKDCMAH